MSAQIFSSGAIYAAPTPDGRGSAFVIQKPHDNAFRLSNADIEQQDCENDGPCRFVAYPVVSDRPILLEFD